MKASVARNPVQPRTRRTRSMRAFVSPKQMMLRFAGDHFPRALCWLLCVVATACGTSSSSEERQSGGDGGAATSDAASAATEPATTEPTEKTAWRSGTRLRAHVIDGGDGALWFAGWRDVELQIECSFVRTPDGAARCLPNLATGETQPFLIGYLDPACTRPFGGGSGTPGAWSLSDVPYYAYERPEAPCAAALPVSKRGEYLRVDGPPIPKTSGGWYQATESGECAWVASAVLPDANEFIPVPLDAFVRAEIIVEPGEIGAVRVVADDGATEVITLTTSDGQPCELFVADDGVPVCLPKSVRQFGATPYFADESCTEPLLEELLGVGCTSSDLATLAPAVACGYAWGGLGRASRLFLAGATPSVAYNLEVSPPPGRGCFVSGPPTSNYRVATATAVPVAPLEVTKVGTGRLQAVFGLSSSGFPAHGSYESRALDDPRNNGSTLPGDRLAAGAWFFDSELDVLCTPRNTQLGYPVSTDQAQRCLPVGLTSNHSTEAPAGGFYADATCTMLAIQLEAGTGCPLPDGATAVIETGVMPSSNGAGDTTTITSILRPSSDTTVSTAYRVPANDPTGCEVAPAITYGLLVQAERTAVERFSVVTSRLE